MAQLEELKEERLKKIKALRENGEIVYKAETKRTHTASDFLSLFEELEGKTSILAGRILSMRGQGALHFFDIFDGTEKVQIVAKVPETEGKTIQYLDSYVDIGDFVEVVGTNFLTKNGQKSLLLKEVSMLSKSLLPLPDKFHGLQDEETKIRKRYLDILTNKDLRDMIEKKSKFWRVVRNFFEEKKFLEVETPTIEVATSGAEARPFKTFHNDFDMPVYMRICIGELWQKRLMAAGLPRTFEIGRAYRNEGSSPDHIQEFTNCEFYMAYASYKDGMELVKELYKKIALEVFGTTTFTTRGYTFDLASEWATIDYRAEVLRQTGIDIEKDTDEKMKEKLIEIGVVYEGTSRERLTDTLWKYCRKSIGGPAFLVNHPLLVAPLAKANADGKTAQIFQPILAGSELGKGYSELNDPIDQRNRFEIQQALIDAGDDEAMMADYDFVEMLEHGMPPTCGFGFGERLFAFLYDKPIREVQTFPLVKPKN